MRRHLFLVGRCFKYVCNGQSWVTSWRWAKQDWDILNNWVEPKKEVK